MKNALIAAIVALALPLGVAQAQSSTSAKKPATKTAAKTTTKTTAKKKTSTKKKTSSKKSTAKRKVPAKTAAAVESETPVETLTSRLTDAELEIAKRIHTGSIPCELGANVTITADEKNPGFFLVTAGKQRYFMHPVESRTGAVRLEDNRAGALWLQLGNKSMLMSQTQGRRIADECAAPEQKLFAAQMKDNPPPSVLESAPQK
ncbi:hypothetical protein [Ottowia sp.]|uniref:hypothetical protein n=1 Tax=Ottowia sp. TaxID=1898956 RepID=UPI003A87DA36